MLHTSNKRLHWLDRYGKIVWLPLTWVNDQMCDDSDRVGFEDWSTVLSRRFNVRIELRGGHNGFARFQNPAEAVQFRLTHL